MHHSNGKVLVMPQQLPHLGLVQAVLLGAQEAGNLQT
jgi:hypothetical protein